jgi:quinol monooxygenase YgiN
MILLRAVFSVPAVQRAGFVDATREMMDKSRVEPGCLYYCFSADLENPVFFHFSEEWASEDALQAHLQTPHLVAFVAYLVKTGIQRTTEGRSGDLQPYQLRRRSGN